MKGKFSFTIWQIIGAAIGLPLLIFGMLNLWAYFELKATFDHCRTAKLANITVDLSKRGMYHGKMQAEEILPHGQVIHLTVSPPYKNEEELKEALAGLSAKLTFLWSSGKSDDVDVVPETFAMEHDQFEPQAPLIIAAHISCPRGVYEVRFEVLEPATAFSGRNQMLVGRYKFCGIETLRCVVTCAIGILCTALGSVIAWVVWRSIRRRWRLSASGISKEVSQ